MTKQLASRPQRFALLAALVGTLTMFPRNVSAQASQSTLNLVLPNVPFFATGCGDSINGKATLHIVFHFTIDAAGGNMFVVHINLEGATAVGASGTTYQVAEVTQEEFTSNGPGLQQEITLVENFHMISPGTAPNWDVHETLHITVNDNGEVTAVVDNTSAECRG